MKKHSESWTTLCRLQTENGSYILNRAEMRLSERKCERMTSQKFDLKLCVVKGDEMIELRATSKSHLPSHENIYVVDDIESTSLGAS